MKMKTKMLLCTGALAVGAIGYVSATPIVGLTSPLLSIGVADNPINLHGVAETPEGGYFNVDLTTDGPANVSVQEFAISAGGHNGWHSHPGMVAVTVLSGTIKWYDGNCRPIIYNAGDSWTEGSKVHYFRNIGTTTAQLTAVFITAKGALYRTDKSAPGCAAALGLE